MPGLVPGIFVLFGSRIKNVDGRDKPGHDDKSHGHDGWCHLAQELVNSAIYAIGRRTRVRTHGGRSSFVRAPAISPTHGA
jgi:hypothetical protein